ncbi:type VI secretion system baseplate subunit TssK [Massilia solisilvae]|uniref:Type VI secretion system baseplate subunit TssK n=1 Tax=Massilia solisilvae TaxID=1811225 RepID=A0ABT2BJC9_9BURK|nr:type VI secretion system baseplate subunit TssK [Massilia solisilvae]MCS0608623.1 type VI secretion system baseplate subunit TssK [Massilia solisilvae]
MSASKILWSEGLTLGPQHFQRQDIYHEARLRHMAKALNPHFWGICSVQWNLDALGHGRLSADAMSVIFPDGEIYDAPGSDLLPDPVDLSRLPPETQTFTFYMSLAVVKPHGGNVADDGRYVRCESEVLDLYSEALAIEVPFLKTKARLVSQLGPRDPHTSLPVVQIRRTAEGGFEIEPSFIPPSVAITPVLKRMADGLISALTAKIETLQRMHRKTNADVYEVSTGDISSWWMLNIVSTANALLMHATRSAGHHPEALYEKLLALAGGLMTFSDRYKTADLPAYRHDALGDVFGKLEVIIRDLVDTVIAAKYFLIPLAADKNRRSFYRGSLDTSRVTRDTQLVLAVNADMPPLELVAAVPARLKLGAPDDLDKIIGSALPGVPLTHMPQVPPAVPVRPNTYYFSVSTKSTLYENALKTGAIAVYVPDGIPGLQIELIAIT